ncbi:MULTISPECIES: DUF2235 domain-containing protein [unclassified Streptomyces]|uniref:DUF2235 domain-containing protein n=1 Tax=unclassified Streptomyces TaxID=2593676 RepID=UPI00224FF7C8|nr:MULTISPECIES: DUF2235 domain-containing protein [unclassified Streptomyces]MCX4987186.1 DUF2235 domain-containing protein [Streptomyces sp. NBC_00568]MCX5007682.1 DUF2235 domain-containing protein [Streptomyces sp. NBC_00638]
MPKNLVICLDGTGNQVKAKGNTNVVRLYEMLDLSDPARQIAYYDPGVGTFSAVGAWTPVGRRLSKLLGLAFGSGMKTNLAEAYTYLMGHYQPGDHIHVFGFSRGAYTARALVGMLKAVGLMRPGMENLVPYAVSVYARNKDWTRQDWDQLHHFAGAFSNAVEGRVGISVAYLGLWDSVKAAGVLRWNLRWPYTRQVPNVAHIRHAVSVDEKRRPYREYLVAPGDGRRPAPGLVEQVWFAGVHSDVGGTFDDDPRTATVALKWIVDGALDAGLLLKKGAYAREVTLVPDDALGRIHRMGRIWALLTYRRRKVPADARVHASVRARDARYRDRIPSTALWADTAWLTPRDAR